MISTFTGLLTNSNRARPVERARARTALEGREWVMSASKVEGSEPVRCFLCDREAGAVPWETKVEIRCKAGCGNYYLSHEALAELEGLSGAGRAVVGEAMRFYLRRFRQYPELVPLIAADDVRNAASRSR